MVIRMFYAKGGKKAKKLSFGMSYGVKGAISN
jgi:hypothetical protein